MFYCFSYKALYRNGNSGGGGVVGPVRVVLVYSATHIVDNIIERKSLTVCYKNSHHSSVWTKKRKEIIRSMCSAPYLWVWLDGEGVLLLSWDKGREVVVVDE